MREPLADVVATMNALADELDAACDAYPIAEPELRTLTLQILGLLQHRVYPVKRQLEAEAAS